MRSSWRSSRAYVVGYHELERREMTHQEQKKAFVCQQSIEPTRCHESSAERFDEPLVIQLGLDSLRRHRADLFDVQCVGRLEDRQGGPEPDGRSNVGAGDQLPESRHRVGGQRPDVGPEPLPPE